MLLAVLTTTACVDTAAPSLDLPVEVAAITVEPAEVTTNVGKQLPLSALAFDTEGNTLDDKHISWTSADTSIAVVSEAGEVTAKRVGSTVITATDGTRTGAATLTVLAPRVASVALTPASASLLAGDTARFAAQPRDDDAHDIDGRSVKWSVANSAIAKVTGGVLVGLAAGTTVLVATVDGVSDSSAITVTARPVASVSVLPASVTLTSGKNAELDTRALDDRGLDVQGPSVTWSTADAKIATVSASGVVTGHSAGTTTVTATVFDKGGKGKGKSAKSTVKVVSAVVPVASVAVSPASAGLVVGASRQFSAAAKGADGASLGGRKIVWKSDDDAIAKVSASGLVTAVAPGKTVIRATSEGKSGSSTVTVTIPPVASVSVSPGSAELLVGRNVTLSATARDADGKPLAGRTISWSSGNRAVATVSSSGVVTAVGAGSAWVMATSESRKDSAAIVVSLPPVASVTVSPSTATLDVGGTRTLSAKLLDASGATLAGRKISWISSDKSVATVSSAGVVTAVGAGSATVTAASEGKQGKASIAVTAPQKPASAPKDSTVSSPPPPVDEPPVDEPPVDEPSSPGGSTGGKHSGIFVSPSGSGSASGSESSPMSLSAALSGGNGRIQAGDTVWLRNGTYKGSFRSTLSGTSSAPIVVRQYPGERATIDGNMTIQGRYTWYWGFEVANTNTGTKDVMGINSLCPGCRFINLSIHDHSGNGLGMWSEGPDQEAYGNVIYNNGFHGSTSSSYGHGIYAQNTSGSKKIIDNVLVNQFGYGLHLYTEGSGLVNFTIDGNTVVNSGQQDGMDYHVGGLQPVKNLVFTNNMNYRNPNRRGNVLRLGYSSGPTNSGAVVTGNYMVGKYLEYHWSGMTFSGNTIIDGATPTATKVVVEPNKYEAGRANVIVYNWGRQGAVSVDLSKVLRSGDHYEIRNAQNYFAAPVASGIYGGGSVSIPLGASSSAPSITGRSMSSTGSEFGVFIVLRN